MRRIWVVPVAAWLACAPETEHPLRGGPDYGQGLAEECLVTGDERAGIVRYSGYHGPAEPDGSDPRADTLPGECPGYPIDNPAACDYRTQPWICTTSVAESPCQADPGDTCTWANRNTAGCATKPIRMLVCGDTAVTCDVTGLKNALDTLKNWLITSSEDCVHGGLRRQYLLELTGGNYTTSDADWTIFGFCPSYDAQLTIKSVCNNNTRVVPTVLQKPLVIDTTEYVTLDGVESNTGSGPNIRVTDQSNYFTLRDTRVVHTGSTEGVQVFDSDYFTMISSSVSTTSGSGKSGIAIECCDRSGVGCSPVTATCGTSATTNSNYAELVDSSFCNSTQKGVWVKGGTGHTFRGTTASLNQDDGIEVDNATNVLLDTILATSNTNTGVRGVEIVDSKNVTVQDSHLWNNYAGLGISQDSDNFVVWNNLIGNNVGDQTAAITVTNQSGVGCSNVVPDGGTVEFNTLHSAGFAVYAVNQCNSAGPGPSFESLRYNLVTENAFGGFCLGTTAYGGKAAFTRPDSLGKNVFWNNCVDNTNPCGNGTGCGHLSAGWLCGATCTGAGDVFGDPRYVEGPRGSGAVNPATYNYYLDSDGVAPDSSAINAAGSLQSSDACGGTYCMNNRTTNPIQTLDTGSADAGYHYAVCRRTDQCGAGRDDCDGDIYTGDYGCETPIATDEANCGACGNVCPPPPAHSASLCIDGMCGFTCNAGYSLCMDGTACCAGNLNCGTCNTTPVAIEPTGTFRYPALVTDQSCGVHVAYTNKPTGDSVKYSYRNPSTGAWSTSVVDSGGQVGRFTDLAIDAVGGLRASYYKKSGKDLKYAYRNPVTTNWTTSVPDSTGDVGWYSSIDVDISGGVHIAYYRRSAGFDDLKYAYYNPVSSTWSTATLDSTGKVGKYASIAVDKNKGVHISYYRHDHYKDLRYAYKNPTTGVWTTSTVDSAGNVGAGTSIAVDKDLGVHIAYLRRSAPRMLKYAYKPLGGLWAIERVANGGISAGQSPSLSLDTSGNAYIAHVRHTGGGCDAGGLWELRLSRKVFDTGVWSHRVVTSSTCVIDQPSVDVDDFGKAFIAYLQQRLSPKDMRVFYVESCPPTCGNGVCQDGEDYCTCQEDCPTVKECCGNGICTAGAGEDPCTCDLDCLGTCCGNDICEPPTEGTGSCQQDCPPAGCGDAHCDAGEDGCNCPEDCDLACCGDGECTHAEQGYDPSHTYYCPDDCLIDCGDNTCDSNEDECTCSRDCSGFC